MVENVENVSADYLFFVAVQIIIIFIIRILIL